MLVSICCTELHSICGSNELDCPNMWDVMESPQSGVVSMCVFRHKRLAHKICVLIGGMIRCDYDETDLVIPTPTFLTQTSFFLSFVFYVLSPVKTLCKRILRQHKTKHLTSVM